MDRKCNLDKRFEPETLREGGGRTPQLAQSGLVAAFFPTSFQVHEPRTPNANSFPDAEVILPEQFFRSGGSRLLHGRENVVSCSLSLRRRLIHFTI